MTDNKQLLYKTGYEDATQEILRFISKRQWSYAATGQKDKASAMKILWQDIKDCFSDVFQDRAANGEKPES